MATSIIWCPHAKMAQNAKTNETTRTYFLASRLLSMSGMRHDGINTSIRTAGSALSATTSTFTSAPPMDAGRAAAKVQAVTRGKKTRSEISMSPPVVSSSQPAIRSPSSPDKLGNSSSRSSRASSPTSILRGERILIQHESAQTDIVRRHGRGGALAYGDCCGGGKRCGRHHCCRGCEGRGRSDGDRTRREARA